jgi:hypothetical protein
LVRQLNAVTSSTQAKDFVAPIEGAKVFNTSAARFIELLDNALVDADYLLPVSLYERLEAFDIQFREARGLFDELLPPWKFPLAIYNHAYQDGMGHAIDHTRAARRTGKDRRHYDLIQRSGTYIDLAELATSEGRYWDAAYSEGYGSGLLALAEQEFPIDSVPKYYCPGIGASTSFHRISKAIQSGRRTHPSAYAWAAKQTKLLPSGMFFSQAPFLNLIDKRNN